MKVRDSGMPEENLWKSFFDVNNILSELEINNQTRNIVEIGCGYGTFTIEVSKKIKGNIYAFDIDSQMIEHVKKKADNENIKNIILLQKDILEETTLLPSSSIDYVMLFNILHNEQPELFFKETFRILKKSGKIGIIHWRCDIYTPRGPDLNIRLKPEEIMNLIDFEKFKIIKQEFILEPYHFGILLSKK